MSQLRFLFTLTLILNYSALHAGLIWYGDPDKGHKIFNNLNFEGAKRHSSGTGTIEPATDPLHGKIWRVTKPAEDKRAEIRGATGFSNHDGKGGCIQLGTPYYIGWRYKFTLSGPTPKHWACFQWKSYPDAANPDTFTQNYPFTMDYDGEKIILTTFGPDWKDNRSRIVTIWSHPLPQKQWVDIILVVCPSLDPDVGYVEVYFNGQHQTLLTGGTRYHCKTMDGLEVSPKWGAYGGGCVGTEITVDLADLRIGTDIESVRPPKRS